MNGKELALPQINVKAGSMFFYPFNMEIDGVHFDYILAQPIAKLAQNGETVCWFVQCEGIEPKYSSGGKVKEIPVDEEGVTEGSVRIIVLPIEKAKTLHIVNGQAVFADGTVYCDNGTMICEKKEDFDYSGRIKLSRCGKVSLPHSYYIYSHGKKQYYTLEIDPSLLEECFDIELQFDFSALNLQVFSGKTLINDWFNINGNFVMRLREYKDYKNGRDLLTPPAERTKFGVGNVYQEIMPPKRETHLKLAAVKKIAVYK